MQEKSYYMLYLVEKVLYSNRKAAMQIAALMLSGLSWYCLLSIADSYIGSWKPGQALYAVIAMILLSLQMHLHIAPMLFWQQKCIALLLWK